MTGNYIKDGTVGYRNYIEDAVGEELFSQGSPTQVLFISL